MSRAPLPQYLVLALREYVGRYGIERLARRLGADNATLECAAAGRGLGPAVGGRLAAAIRRLTEDEARHVQPKLFGEENR